jgi:TolB-like protein
MMKRALIATVLALIAFSAAALPKVAVLNPTLAKGIDEGTGSFIVDKILSQLIASRTFNILDRASRDVIWQERNFQLSSGEIKQSEIKEVGKGLGADYVVIVKVTRVGTLLSMSTTMINVETLEVIGQSSSEAKDSIENLLKLASYCGENIADDFDGQAAPGKSVATVEPDVAVEPDLPPGDFSQVKNDIRAMLKRKMFMKAAGRISISAKAGALPDMDRNGLYLEYKKNTADALLGFLLNVVPIVKVGSLVQGDIDGFILYALWEGVGLGMMIDGVTVMDQDMEAGSAEVGAGALILSVGYILGLIQPFSYVSGWNKNLAKSLSVMTVMAEEARSSSIVMAPRIGPTPSARITLASFRY